MHRSILRIRKGSENQVAEMKLILSEQFSGKSLLVVN
ncbi:hypothetical protein T01_16012 [Trichinella spiralis]|uniref:Uncharacterized protein n=1 Tax=Trichinella spiralis TaxID=6334 RepID=A0A0V1AIW1_TRISP|nr:hypothetical protein T01_16012 [Trichinella spiralis]